jgi:hypothetical protein
LESHEGLLSIHSLNFYKRTQFIDCAKGQVDDVVLSGERT